MTASLVLPAGFYGKLPARGDFVRSGLPRDFTDAWDEWLSNVMSVTKGIVGDAWLPAFLEAPVWRFMLPPGLCGERAVIGLMMPSVDRAGRYFPLSFGAALNGAGPRRTGALDAWLDLCEDAGRAALEQDLEPDAVKAMIGIPNLELANAPLLVSEWWTEGSRRLGPTQMTQRSLPSAAVYADMLGIEMQTVSLG